MLLDELLIKIGVDIDAEDLKAFEQSLSELGISAQTAAGEIEKAFDKIEPDLSAFEQTISEALAEGLKASDANIESITALIEERLSAVGTSFEELVNIMVDNDMAKVASEGAAEKVRTNLEEYLEKGIVK